MEIKELRPLDEYLQQKLAWGLTLIVPSNVLAMTRRFKASVAKLVTQRSLALGLDVVFNRSVTA